MKLFSIRVRYVLTGVLAAGAMAVLVQGRSVAEEPMSAADASRIEAMIHQYIMDHPEVILESVQALREREEQAALEQVSANLVALRDSLANDTGAPFAGNPDGDVTIVEFFDYRCGYCKRSLPVLRQLLDEDPNVRIVFKEFPILSPESATAARAALASHRQGKYFPFHNALMNALGSLDDTQILDIAAEVGLDLAQLQADMESPEIAAIIDQTAEIAQALDIRGTPAFIVGDQIYPGALDIDALRQIISEQRQG